MIMMGRKKDIIGQILGPVDKEDGEEAPHDHSEALKAVVSEFIDAVHSKDVEGACTALQTAFEEMEAAPHEEGEHTNEQE